MAKYFSILGLLVFLFFAGSCDKNDHPNAPGILNDSILVKGSGSFVFSSYAPLKDKPIRIWYHIPETSTSQTALLIVFTGASRDARESRDQMIADANKKNVMIFVPEFSDSLYPGSDQYNMGNVFVDGDNPSAATLNDESVWTFSVIEPLFDYIQLLTGHNLPSYDVFGHSAGGQFVHRFIYFKPKARVNQAVASSSGWYTVPDTQIDFPYGLKQAPGTDADLTAYFKFPLYVCVGAKDNDPNSASLRHNAQADAQGLNRLDRANYYFNTSKNLAAGRNELFNWKFSIVPNAGHDFALTSNFAMNLLYP